MILNFIDTPLNPDAWESLCDACYRLRYQKDNYQKIPAKVGGDAGIEGFTQSGIVYQCYYPDRDYDDDALYEHQRNKLTRDIAKLLDQGYKDRLNTLGVPVIKQWDFVIPYYKDNRILVHAATKRKEVLAEKLRNPEACNHLDDGFLIVIKVAEDFKVEISKTIRETLTDIKLNIVSNSTISWEECASEKVDNIRRKIRAVMSAPIDNADLNDVVREYVTYYMKGIEVLHMLQADFPEIYEHIYQLEQACKRQVGIRTKMNQDHSVNSTIFYEILAEFEKQLTLEFSKYFALASILELKHEMVGAWLADCPMEFRNG